MHHGFLHADAPPHAADAVQSATAAVSKKTWTQIATSGSKALTTPLSHFPRYEVRFQSV